MNPSEEFRKERENQIQKMAEDAEFVSLSQRWLRESMQRRYVYNFDWLGRPIIQYPQDIVAIQELVWQVQPDLIIETGIAHGGSLILSASLLALLDLADAATKSTTVDPRNSTRTVIGIDIDIRSHNKVAIEAHPLSSYIQMIQGSSIDPSIVSQIKEAAKGFDKVLVFLDSMHTHSHVLAELDAYAPLVSQGSYCVVFDTFVEDMPPGFFANRPWDVSNNPKTAVSHWLQMHPEFEAVPDWQEKLMVTVAPDGFLRRI